MWVLVLISLNFATPLYQVEGAYSRMDECFLARERYIPSTPKAGTQGICIRIE